MDFEKSHLIETFTNYKSNLEKIWNRSFNNNFKNSQNSEDYKKRGNDLFLQKDHKDDKHKEIFTYYNRSVAHAPIQSKELTYAYGNRAAFLLHVRMYEECIKDCNRAFKIGQSEAFKCKMLCRKAESLKKLGSHEYESVLIEAKQICDEMSDDKNKIQVTDLIDKVKNIPVKNVEQAGNREHKLATLPAVTDKFSDFVRIEHNEKYGRHLVANKDYEPGDVIITEKLYAYSVIRESESYSYCHNCLKVLWSGVPCDHCTWAMFCSEGCYQEAWRTYHNVECASISFLKEVELAWSTFRLSLRILLLGIKDAGSISKLKAALELVDQSTDVIKDFPLNGKFDTFERLYSLSSRFPNDDFMEYESQVVAKVLIGLVRHTKLLDNNEPKSFEDFLNNDNITFLGSLLIRISLILVLNSYALSPWENHFNNLLGQDKKDYSDTYGSGLGPLTSLLNHSCSPNANRYITEDHKIIIVAFHPIKKNSQIFIQYCDIFEATPIEERHEYLEKYYFKCDCQACTENWPPVALMPLEQRMRFYSSCRDPQTLDLINTYKTLFENLIINGDAYLNKKDLGKLSKAISKGYTYLKKPSFLMSLLTDLLHHNLSQMYSVKLQTFSPCGRSDE